MSRGDKGSLLPAKVSSSYKALALAAVVAVFALVVLEGVVRATDSGLGCPDWPLCYGSVIPPLNGPTLLEYSHRLAASMASVLVVTVAVLTWRSHLRERWLLLPATIGVLLLLGEIVLGGITVLMELPPLTVAAHFAIAQVLLASMVTVYVVTQSRYKDSGVEHVLVSTGDDFPKLALAMLVLTYVVLLSGSYVMASGASSACTEWPLCQGGILPQGVLTLLHMAHRYLTLPMAALAILLIVGAWRHRRECPALALASCWMGGLLAIQVLIGALNIWLGFPPQTEVLHLAAATAVWGSVVALAVLAQVDSESSSEETSVGLKLEPGAKRGLS